MYHNVFKICSLVACVAMSCGVAYADNDEDLNKFAQEVTKIQNISPEVAMQAVKQTDEMGEIVADIRDTLRGRVAGIYAEYSPKFTVVVRLKGNGSPPKKAYDLAQRHPIRFETGSKFTVEELVESYDRNFEQIKALVPSVQGIGVDEKNGQIVISILNKDDQNNQAKNQIKKLLGKPVKFEVQENETVDANLRAGSKILSDTFCTSGFTVKHTNGTLGMSTSAHCEGVHTYTDTAGNKTKLTLIPNTELKNARQDVEIHTNANKTGLAEFYGENNKITKVTGRISRASTYEGMPVCHQGAATGYSCGIVELTSHKPTYDKACGTQVCDSTWVKVVPASSNTLACYPGDSGGPVFNGTKALGLLKGSTRIGTNKGQCGHFVYMTMDYLPTGWSVLYAK